MRMSDWSSDVCSSDLVVQGLRACGVPLPLVDEGRAACFFQQADGPPQRVARARRQLAGRDEVPVGGKPSVPGAIALVRPVPAWRLPKAVVQGAAPGARADRDAKRDPEARTTRAAHAERVKVSETIFLTGERADR